MLHYNCSCFQEHLRVILKSLRAVCKAPRVPGSSWILFEALVRSTRVSGRIHCTCWADLHLADSVSQC